MAYLFFKDNSVPSSAPNGKNEAVKWVNKNIPKGSLLLDVGPGIGTWASLLKGYEIDCIEIFEPYVEKYNLNIKYKNVIIGNIKEVALNKIYKLVIMGDVLEHLTVEDAVITLNKLKQKTENILIIVPWLYKQGIHQGNIYETHLQPDLTENIMQARYPELIPIFTDDKKGVYTWSR